MNKEAKLKKLIAVWKKAKASGSDCYDEVEYWMSAECYFSDYQNGYLDAKMEDIGNCLSSDDEPWIYEVESVIRQLLE